MTSGNGKNFYKILGVTPDSDAAEIKAAYRRLARKYHPDVNKSLEAVAIFKEITAAYETLSDNVKRNQYNILHGYFRTYKAEFKDTKTSKEPKFEDRTKQKENAKPNTEKREPPPKKEKQAESTPPPASPPPKTEYRQASSAKSSKNVFSDIIDEFTKSAKKTKSSSPEPKKGTDINADISITLSESVKGASRTVNVMHTHQCTKCKGRKFINGAKCVECTGSGEVSEHKKITVKIPPNIKNGSKLRIPNEGNCGLYGGKNGDLFLKVTIEQGSRMKYEGINVLYDVPITPYEAALGASILIPGLDGNITLKIPPKTNSGQKFRLAEQGLVKNSKKGDMIVTVSIEIPDNLSDDEIRLYEKLKKTSSKNVRENLLNE